MRVSKTGWNEARMEIIWKRRKSMKELSVRKRSGSIVPFELGKIEAAVGKAFEATGTPATKEILETMALKASADISPKISAEGIIGIEDIQDSVEKILGENGFYNVAKAYIRYRDEHAKQRDIEATINYKEKVNSYLGIGDFRNWQKAIQDWRVKENSSAGFSYGAFKTSLSDAMIACYWLSEIYDPEIADAHRNCDLHLHDLSGLNGYCAGWSLRQLITEGLGGVTGKVCSAPPKHLTTLCNQMVNFLGILQNEWAGAQAFSSFDTYLAPFVKADHLTFREVKQAIQCFVFGVNTPSRWSSQAPFSNITLDWVCPKDMRDTPAIVGGKEMDFTYGDCQEEMDTVNKAFLEIMIGGDADGRGFAYPIPTYSITKDFDWSDTENNRLLFEMAAKYGTPYFSNYINSDMEPSDVRSMCPLTGDTMVIVKDDSGEKILAIRDVYEQYGDGNGSKVWTGREWANGHPVIMPMTDICCFTLTDGEVIRMGVNHLQPTGTAEQFRAGQYVTKKAEDIEEGDVLPRYQLNGAISGIIGTEKIIRKTIEKGIPNEFLYCFEVNNSDHLFMLANGIITHNCRLRLDLRELRRKSGGFFGSGESTGSVGVVTINLPKLGYLSKDEADFYARLDHLMDIAARSLRIKREAITKLYDADLYPYTKRYLGDAKFTNHFSTIGVLGMHECGLNARWLRAGMDDERTQKFAVDILNHMRNKLSDYQELYGDLYNLESTPAEGTCYRFARHDTQAYPDIKTSGSGKDIFYTNSTNLPVSYTDDIFSALDIQDGIQTLYTSGTVFHAFLGERLPDWKACATLVRKIAENYRLPYYTMSPTYSVCPDHGYIIGEHAKCPVCGKETEIYSRITGYYRPVKAWNIGKSEEFRERKTYDVSGAYKPAAKDKGCDSEDTCGKERKTYDAEMKEKAVKKTEPAAGLSGERLPDGVYLFTTSVCPKCRALKPGLDFQYREMVTDTDPAAMKAASAFHLRQAPTLVIIRKGEGNVYANYTGASGARALNEIIKRTEGM